MVKIKTPRLRKVKREFRVLMCGLDDAGKTALLHRMKTNEFVPTHATIGYNVELVWVSKKGVHFTVWDVGGGHHVRPLWKFFFNDKQGIIFVVDASDEKRLPEACDTLHSLLREHELRDALLLIMATRRDRHGAMDAEAIHKGLRLDNIRNRDFYVQMCDNESGRGVVEGLDWLCVKAHATGDLKR